MMKLIRGKQPRIVIIGAGIGGLTTAAYLSRIGLEVTVLEAHVYPGGCAGTFLHKGFRFDAGATLAAGFYPDGPMERVAREIGLSVWPAEPDSLAMTVHFPDKTKINLWNDERRWEERANAFSREWESFWHWQEQTADLLWDLALRLPPWPPRNFSDTPGLLSSGARWASDNFPDGLNASLVMDVFRPISAHLKDASERLKLFIDAQLLISAQTTSEHTNALYAASALDLSRRGIVHFEGGIGTIAQTLARQIESNGSKILYRRQVDHVIRKRGKPSAVVTKYDETFLADMIIFNLPPDNITSLLDPVRGLINKQRSKQPNDGWGAFMIYAGLDNAIIPEDFPLHHQIIRRRPLGEGNSIFMSFSPEWDPHRAPPGQRAITVSTHTSLAKWWNLYENNPTEYEELKNRYIEKLITSAEIALPAFRKGITFLMPGTPVTFQRYTRRSRGWVGGYPQTSLFRTQHPQIGDGLWMVGDSIFPGQSIAATAIGGLRVARNIQKSMGISHKDIDQHIPDRKLSDPKITQGFPQ
jgi:C-3',4' desaturase CrtD